MLWLKSWLETRWKMVWMVLMGVLLFGFLLEALGGARIQHPQQFLFVLLRLSIFLCFIAAIMLAGSGIQTASPRPGADKGSEGSTLFTLSLPVTRTRLFAVRTVTGVLEMVALLTLFGFVIWLLVPRLATNAQVGLGYFAVIVSSSLAVYAISACLSTFCDEGWRFRGSGLVVVALFMLSNAGKLPQSINIFGGIGGVTSPLVMQPWVTVATTCVLALLFFGAALLIIQRRDY
ncbi:MAG: hypothetical protein WBE91_12560 [Steroidobacteraceae bacterium]